MIDYIYNHLAKTVENIIVQNNFFLIFLGLRPQHIEVPRQGVESEL